MDELKLALNSMKLAQQVELTKMVDAAMNSVVVYLALSDRID